MATTKTTKRAPRKSSAKAGAAKPAAKKSTAIIKRPQPLTLITGGTGFLGAHLLRQLIEDGVKNLRVMTTSAPAWLRELDVEIIEGSITEAADVARAVKGVAEIYHLAGRVSREDEDAREMYSVHVEGTRLLCEAASAEGTSAIVMASTSGTIAVREKNEGVPDETGAQPVDIISRWPYYASKLYQERVALNGFKGAGRRLVILNPSLLLGPGDERLSSTKIVLDFLARKITATPTGGLSFVDVRDAASAFRAAMKAGRSGERYLLGSANWSFEKFFGRLERLTNVRAPRFTFPSRLAVTGSQIIHAFYKQWDKAPPVEPAAIEMAEYFWYLDSSRAERELGFSPRDTGETLLDTVKYLRENFLAVS